MEINFKRPELEDKEIVDSYLSQQKNTICEMTFANTYLWSRHFAVTYAIIEGMLVYRSLDEESPSFVYPIGKGDVKAVIDILSKYCDENGYPFLMHHVTESQFEKLEELYPGRFEIEYMRDYADYVYETEKLITLSGKKYHGKRNHINRFKANNQVWNFEFITDDNIEDCFQMAMKWRKQNICDDDESKTAELCVTLNALRLMKELDLKGGLIRVKDQVIAFTVGEPLSDDTFVIHIEKAFADIQGAYPIINQQFLENGVMDYKYVNREEDMGEEGLRKAKLSYRPVFLSEKGKVREK